MAHVTWGSQFDPPKYVDSAYAFYSKWIFNKIGEIKISFPRLDIFEISFSV